MPVLTLVDHVSSQETIPPQETLSVRIIDHKSKRTLSPVKGIMRNNIEWKAIKRLTVSVRKGRKELVFLSLSCQSRKSKDAGYPCRSGFLIYYYK